MEVGPDERKLLTGSGLGTSANGESMEAFRESEFLWWVLLMILSQAFKKMIVQCVAGGADPQQERSLAPGHVREPSF